jgi:quercetin dioxygenase-like cupin family protein
MELVKRVGEHIGTQAGKFYKTTLFRADSLLLGLNCLDPGQTQKAHEHADQDKFYYIFEGNGRFWLGDEQVDAAEGDIIWAPAGISHGVTNLSAARLTLLVGIAPAP